MFLPQLCQPDTVRAPKNANTGRKSQVEIGAADPGKKDCHDRTDRLEERSVLRRPISETTNSLSVSDRIRSIPGILSSGGRGVLETL